MRRCGSLININPSDGKQKKNEVEEKLPVNVNGFFGPKFEIQVQNKSYVTTKVIFESCYKLIFLNYLRNKIFACS